MPIFTPLSPVALNSTGKCRYSEPTEILWQKQRFLSDKWNFANTSCTQILLFRNLRRSLARIVNFPWGKAMQNQNPPSARTEENQELQKAFNMQPSHAAKVMRRLVKPSPNLTQWHPYIHKTCVEVTISEQVQ